MTGPDHHLSFLSRPVLGRLLVLFLPAALLTCAVVAALYYMDLAKDQTLFRQAGDHLVDLQRGIIDRELQAVQSDLRYLAGQAVLRNYLSGSTASKKELEDEYALLCKERGVYDQIRYLDAEGQERIRINYNDGNPVIVPEKELQSKANRYYFTQTMSLKRDEVFVSPLDLNVEHDKIEEPFKPVIRFATPVFDRNNVKRGVLILNYLGSALLDKLAEVSVSFPGSSWLLNRDGYFLRGPSAQEEWAFMWADSSRRFPAYYPDEWNAVAWSSRGQTLTGQGMFTFQTLFPRETQSVGHHEPVNSEDRDLADAGLIVVAHLSPQILDARANSLLGRLLWLWGLVLLFLLGLAWYLSKASVLRRNHERRIAESETRLRALSAQLITAQEDERRRLSRDLHDELGQIVTAVTLDLQRAAQAETAKKNDLLQQATQETRCLLDKIHEITVRIRPTLLDDLGLKDAVQSLLGDFERRTGIATRSELSFDRASIPASTSENVFRILQEALTNIAKHANAKEVMVKLRVTERQVHLSVLDAGTGFAPAEVNGHGLGLLGMRERAELLDGSFHVNAESGKGTEILVTIPLPPLEQAGL
jgi:signal transduction histidine kinase